jgi:hypothetical protein
MQRKRVNAMMTFFLAHHVPVHVVVGLIVMAKVE